MTDKPQYKIQCMADFMALTAEQRRRCAADMLAWADFMDAYAAEPVPGLSGITDHFIWVDDDDHGTVSGVIIVPQEVAP